MPTNAKFKLLLLFVTLPVFVFAKYPTQSTISRDTTAGLIITDALQNSMVVQQNKPFKVWGHAPAGKVVTIKASWLNEPVTVMADSAKNFLGIINVPAAKKGDYTKQRLTVISGPNKVVLQNLLIGDVWFCSGQSNMQFPMRDLVDGAKKIDSVNNPYIRLLSVNFNWKSVTVDTIAGRWAECNPKTLKDFSAVGYYFANEIQARLDIPIGVIYSGIGGSVTQAYVARDVLEADSVLKAKYLEPFYKTDAYKNNQLNGFSWSTTSYPYLIYNAMIYPFFNLSIKGILWYQGESNREQRDEYVKLNYTLIESWRKSFAQGSLPFYYVQVAPHAYGKLDSTLNDCAFFREAQEKIAKRSNTAMVVTMDIGDKDDIHPKNKKPVGLRLAYTALNRTYDMQDVAYLGPHYHHAIFTRHQAIIYFGEGTMAGGLKTNDGQVPRHFFVADTDQVFHYADARIEGNTIILTCKSVKHPVAVRYAFTNYPTTNLQNGVDLPAVPFRTDDWPEAVVNAGK
ncbi:hypothetical protein A0256_03900 [Mucilaginibacter sp. PAMC 26640]|nr:hypothetical protein A0256_03900 [Mucilaginibacter sp. PAMC 26640]